MIYCHDDQGNTIPVAAELVQFQPAAYGILIDEYDQVLLLRQPGSDLLLPPGGPLGPQKTPKQAVRFHFRRAIGITPHVGDLLLVEDQYRFVDGTEARHLSVMYFNLKKPTLTANTLGGTDQVSAEAAWIPIIELNRSQMLMGWDAIQASRLHQKLQAANANAAP